MTEVNENQNAGGIIGAFQTGSVDHTYSIETLNLVNGGRFNSNQFKSCNGSRNERLEPSYH